MNSDNKITNVDRIFDECCDLYCGLPHKSHLQWKWHNTRREKLGGKHMRDDVSLSA